MNLLYHRISIKVHQARQMFYWAVTTLLLFCGNVCFAVPYEPSPEGFPKRLSRSESFLGIHFDFHANANDMRIGENVSAEMVNAVIDKVSPDYIQIDCKGHSGFSSYPTKVGNPAGGFVRDALQIWREVTAQRGVALYMHYSGVWDSQAVACHPEWAAINSDGQPDKEKTSVFGPYVDKLLIPQLKELRHQYGVDGFWIDGECWAAIPDYNPAVIEQFQKQTGISQIPQKPSEPYWYEWMSFHRRGFTTYLKHYVDTIHRECPGAEITSNWAYSSLMPEPVGVNLDFLSGDYTLQDSVRAANWQARCLRLQGKPWDLMAWGFSCSKENFSWQSTKTDEQLKREAAIVLAAGGGFQCYFTQCRDASVRLWQMEVMAEVARFCRQRQKFCHRSESVPEVALFYSTQAIYRKLPRLYHPHEFVIPIRGVLESIIDNQYHVDVLMEHHLQGQLGKYPLIVFPEWEYIEASLRSALLTYVQEGGNLLIIGPKSIEFFKDELGIASLDKSQKQIRWLFCQGKGAGLNTEMVYSQFLPEVQTIGSFEPDNQPASSGWPAASIRSLGKGQIAGIYANLGRSYFNETTTVMRDFVGDVIRRLLPQRQVEVFGSRSVQVMVNRVNLEGKDRLTVHLINMAGSHRDTNVCTFDEIQPIGPLTVHVRLAQKPQHIMLQPAGQILKFTYANGIAHVVLPRLDIYDILIIEE